MTNLDLYNKVKVVPKEAQKEIKGGRLSGFTDINPMWRLRTLTEEFGAVGEGWYTDNVFFQIHVGDGGVQVVSCTLDLFYKIGDEWSKPVFGVGGSMLTAKESKGLYTSDECHKMAYTDALSVACKALGMGADVYWSQGSKYTDNKPTQEAPQQTTNTQEDKLVCSECGESITKAIATMSEHKFGARLCPVCQK